jgi:hypothetical protein
MFYLSKLSEALIDQTEYKALYKLILCIQNIISVYGLYFFKTVYTGMKWTNYLGWYISVTVGVISFNLPYY